MFFASLPFTHMEQDSWFISQSLVMGIYLNHDFDELLQC